ncbi:hypothetical protein EGJ09_02420 [Pseudomonas sp. p106]|jgi:hypothetical protein|uniref:Uncharacterized protein n=2 Tax=Pseudomonas TaxID=286 RepID=A0A7Y7ZCF0_PSEPU|nr:hypothetical protein [Pseudomonas putida]QPN42701.1 hypothetical protein I5S86_13995 [Priestia aryabhattai]RRV49809.1 hypothetical protein EGJ09_02420 [Pseudomonas sp. p106]
MERKIMSVTLKCLECDGQDLVKPGRLHRKSIITCRECNAIAQYGDLLEAAGRRLLAELQQQLAGLKAG